MDTPIISPISGHGMVINSRYTRLYNNPHFDYLTEMLPRDIKELFKWCELVFQNTPTVANGVRKLINYPVTEFSFEEEAEAKREETKKLIKTIRLKSELLEYGNDWYVYGNVFRSVYFPFKRFLVCRKCHGLVAIEEAKFKVKKKDFILDCSCHYSGAADIKDVPSHDIRQIRIVHWDPKQIELNQNQITGATTYYYQIPKKLVDAVFRGDLTILRNTPKIFIDAALQRRNVEMGSNFFHAKAPSLSGYSSGWGISPLLPTLKGYMYIAVLRRAAEAIGMEHITPQRILYPQTNGTTDPALASSMERWRNEITQALERWRLDPNFVMTAPYPTGLTNIGSQGRQLTPTEEIKDARMEMTLALDIPPSLVMGDTTIQNSAVGLRILENQLLPHTENLELFANWVISLINAEMNKSYSPVTLVPFRLADDIMNKQILLQSQGTAVSKATLQEALNLDPDKERQRMKEDQLADHDSQKEMEAEITRREQDLAAQAQAQEQSMATGQIPQYNQQKMIALAQQQAMEMINVPYEQRRSMLAQLQNEDYIMWALVSKQLESMREQASEQPAQQQ